MERTQRELDRERVKLERQEKQIVMEIKKSVKTNQLKLAKIQAKDLVRTKKNIEKFAKMKVQIQAISLRIQSVRSSDQMAQSMRSATSLLNQMNRSMNLPQLSKIAMDFQRENDIMDQRQEMVDDTMDDLMDDELDEDDEEEADDILNRVLDEIGVDLNQNLKDTPTGDLTAPQEQLSTARVAQLLGGEGAPASTGDDDLEARFNNLKKGD